MNKLEAQLQYVFIEKCRNEDIYRSQLKRERSWGYNDEGTEGYRRMGCDKCNGFNWQCDAYTGGYTEI